MKACSRPRGFTLIEMATSVGLIALLAVTANYFWVNGFSLTRTVNADSAAMAEGRIVLERLAREIHEVKYDSSSGAYCVSTKSATQMVFSKTSQSEPVSPGCGNNDFSVNVHLTAGTTTLTLGYASPAITRTLTIYASAFSIRYLDVNYAPTASNSALCFVELSLTVQPGGVQPFGVQATQLRTVVALRNS
jgi:prepilin-type N-terminal cleavage/methylation domain-containing protein